jgi:hypothetical protein
MTDPACPFPGIPLIESPVFGAELDRMALSPTERDLAIALNRDGYAVIDFPDPSLDERIARIRANLAPELGINDLDPTSNKQTGVGRVQDAWKADPDVKAIAANPAMLDLLSRLYGRRAFPFQTLNFAAGTQQHLHTDAVHFSSIPQRFMCGVWVALEDIAADAGPLCYVPGSHKWPILDNALIGRRGAGQELASAQDPYHEAWDALIAEHPRPTELFFARKGQALIWCANLLHGGSVQHDPRLTRWSQVTHYYFDDCIYYTPAFSDEYLGRLALRKLVSIADGAPKPNLYLGEEILPIAPVTAPRAARSRVAVVGRGIVRAWRRRKAARAP